MFFILYNSFDLQEPTFSFDDPNAMADDAGLRGFLKNTLKVHQILALVDVSFESVLSNVPVLPEHASLEQLHEREESYRRAVMKHFLELSIQLKERNGLNYVPRERTPDGRLFEHASASCILIHHLSNLKPKNQDDADESADQHNTSNFMHSYRNDESFNDGQNDGQGISGKKTTGNNDSHAKQSMPTPTETRPRKSKKFKYMTAEQLLQQERGEKQTVQNVDSTAKDSPAARPVPEVQADHPSSDQAVKDEAGAEAPAGGEVGQYFIQLLDPNDIDSDVTSMTIDKQAILKEINIINGQQQIMMKLPKEFLDLRSKAKGKADLYFNAYFWQEYLKSLDAVQEATWTPR